MKGYAVDRLSRLSSDFLNNYSTSSNRWNIGVFGDINFLVDRYNEVLSPSSLDIKSQAKIEKFDNLGNEQYSQFIRAELKTIDLTFKLLSTLTNIDKFIDKISKIHSNGENYPLMLGNKALSIHNFIITSYNVRYVEVDAQGKAELVEVQLSMQEYIEKIKRNSKDNIIKKKDNDLKGIKSDNQNAEDRIAEEEYRIAEEEYRIAEEEAEKEYLEAEKELTGLI